LADLIAQVSNRMLHRSEAVIQAALVSETDWVRDLQTFLGQVGPEDTNRLIRAVAIFRDRWGIDNSPLPLGPVPPDYEWEQKLQRIEIERQIAQASLPASVAPQRIDVRVDEPDFGDSPLMNVGWQL
jgi:hypothetical protein